jgi:hypothetical protein
MTDNRVMWAYAAITIDRPCEGILTWSNNLASGSYVGHHIRAGGCGTLALESYRNAIGISAAPAVPEVANVLAVENGVGLINQDFVMPPEKIPSLSWRWFRGQTNFVDSVVIGRSKASIARSTNCAEVWHAPMSSGGKNTPFRVNGGQWHYVGIQITGSDGIHAASANSFVEIDGPGPPGPVKRPSRFPQQIGFVWRCCMGAHGA